MAIPPISSFKSPQIDLAATPFVSNPSLKMPLVPVLKESPDKDWFDRFGSAGLFSVALGSAAFNLKPVGPPQILNSSARQMAANVWGMQPEEVIPEIRATTAAAGGVKVFLTGLGETIVSEAPFAAVIGFGLAGGILGVGAGLGFNWLFEKLTGESFGAKIYDWTHSEWNPPQIVKRPEPPKRSPPPLTQTEFESLVRRYQQSLPDLDPNCLRLLIGSWFGVASNQSSWSPAFSQPVAHGSTPDATAKILPFPGVDDEEAWKKGFQVHPSLANLPDRSILPLTSHYADQFSKGERGAGRIYHKELGTVLNIKNFSLTVKRPEGPFSGKLTPADSRTLKVDGHPVLADQLVKNPDPFAQNPEEVDAILLALHGATHPEKSLGASLLVPLGIIQERARTKGMHVVTLMPDLPIHGLGPVDSRFKNQIDFYISWLLNIFKEAHRVYPRALIYVYGRSTGANATLSLAYQDSSKNRIRIKGFFADAPYPPGTLALQTQAILDRDAQAGIKHEGIPGSEAMLEAYDPHWPFWHQDKPPPMRDKLVRIGRGDDNYALFDQARMWNPWSQRTGVPLKIDNGEHNGLGGLQQTKDPQAFAISDANADEIVQMIQRGLANNLHWRLLDKKRKRKALKDAKAHLEGVETKLEVLQKRHKDRLAAVEKAREQLVDLKKELNSEGVLILEAEQKISAMPNNPEVLALFQELKQGQERTHIIYTEIFRSKDQNPKIEQEKRQGEIDFLKIRIKELDAKLQGKLGNTPLASIYNEYQRMVRDRTHHLNNVRKREKGVLLSEKEVVLTQEKLKGAEQNVRDARQKVKEGRQALIEASQAFEDLRIKKETKRLAKKEIPVSSL